MRYSIHFKLSAEKSFAKLAKKEQLKIFKAIETLADNPRPHGVKKLKSKTPLYRIRVGDYRVIYTIEKDRVLISIVKIAHRRDVYKL